jgi:hypothetical protein
MKRLIVKYELSERLLLGKAVLRPSYFAPFFAGPLHHSAVMRALFRTVPSYFFLTDISITNYISSRLLLEKDREILFNPSNLKRKNFINSFLYCKHTKTQLTQ